MRLNKLTVQKLACVFCMMILSIVLCMAAEKMSKIDDSSIYTVDIIFSVNNKSEDVITHTIEECDSIEKVSYCKLLYDEGDDLVQFYQAVIEIKDGYEHDSVVEELNNTGCFKDVELDDTLYAGAVADTKSDPYMEDQWCLGAIDADKTWKNIDDEPGKDVVVAVIDTGVNYKHADLKNNMWINEAEYNGRSGYDDDGNGVKDDIYGANFSNEADTSNKATIGKVTFPGSESAAEGNPDDTDKDGHGSHVAGIIAMTAGNGGGCGIAYGTKIMAVKSGESDGSFKVSNVIEGINYAVKMKADVINMSFGTYSDSAVIKLVLQSASKQCILVAAAGNDGLPTAEAMTDKAADVYPASYPYVIGVMAEDENNEITTWSNYDAEPHSLYEYDIAAPGKNILSTTLNNKYAYMSGTSMAAPVVSAAAAILLGEVDRSVNPDYITYVRNQIVNGSTHEARKVTDTGEVINYPALNVYDSLVSKPEVNLQLSSIYFYDPERNQDIYDGYEVEPGKKLNILCGYVVNNRWKAVKDVKITMTAANAECSVIYGDSAINEMEGTSYIAVNVSEQEAMYFTFMGEAGKTYNIPVTFKVECRDSEDDTAYTRTFEKSIRICVKDSVATVGNQGANSANNLENGTQTNTSLAKDLSAPSIPNLFVKDAYIKVTWDNLSCADSINLYRANKKNGTYKLVKNIDAGLSRSYKDKNVKKGVTYYYKTAYQYNDGTTGALSKPAYCALMGKVSGVKVSSGKVVWNKIANATGYKIYFSYQKKTGYKLLKTVKKFSYKMSNKLIKAGRVKPVYLKIRAYSKGSNLTVKGKFSRIYLYKK